MRIFAPFVLVLLLPALAGAQSNGGIGTRAEGMGGAFVAVADDATAVYWNPAGIATGATFDAQISAGKGSTLFVGAALPVLAFSVYRTHTVQPDRDRQNGGSGEVPVRLLSTTNVGVTTVQTVLPGLVIGTTIRMVRGGIEPAESRTTLDLDAGAMLSAWDMRFGVVARNLRRPEFASDSSPVRLRREVRVGAALAPRSLPTGVHGPYSVAVDADLTTTLTAKGDTRTAAVGGEYWLLLGRVGARAGVRWSTLGDLNRAFSVGLTVKLPRSIHVEGQLTEPEDSGDRQWNFGTRITF